MRIDVSKPKIDYKPISLNVTIDTKQEALILATLFGHIDIGIARLIRGQSINEEYFGEVEESEIFYMVENLYSALQPELAEQGLL